MADKDNESAPGVVCCNLGAEDVKRLFWLTNRGGGTIQDKATSLLKDAIWLKTWELGYDDE